MSILEGYEIVRAVLLVAFSVLAFGISLLWRRKDLPPGPFPLPFIGCLYLFGTKPESSLASLARKYGPAMSLRIGTVNTVILSSRETVKLFLRAHEMQFINRPQLTVSEHLFMPGEDMGFTPYGDHWKALRMVMVNNLLSPKSLESFAKVREDHVARMMSKLWTDSRQGTVRVDLTEAIFNTLYDIVWATVARNTPSIMSKELLGFPRQAAQLIATGLLYDCFPWLKPLEPFLGIKRRMKKAYNSFHIFADAVLREHEGTEIAEGDSKSLIDQLLDICKEDSSYTRKHIKSTLLTFHVSSAHSTGVTSEWTLSHLLNKPECLSKAQKEVDEIMGSESNTVKESDVAEMKYLRCVVKETMRMNMSTFLPPRVAKQDVRIDKYNIAKGTWVIVNGWALDRDATVWEDPDAFKPARFENEKETDTAQADFKTLPFGTGRRGCPGYKLAFQIILLIVSSLLHHFEVGMEGDPSNLDMTADRQLKTRKNHLCVLLKLRKKGE